MLLRVLSKRAIFSSFHQRKFSSSSCPVYFLADACHGQGYNLAHALLNRTSSCALLAAVTQSSSCEVDLKQKFWDGDKIFTSTILTCQVTKMRSQSSSIEWNMVSDQLMYSWRIVEKSRLDGGGILQQGRLAFMRYMPLSGCVCTKT